MSIMATGRKGSWRGLRKTLNLFTVVFSFGSFRALVEFPMVPALFGPAFARVQPTILSAVVTRRLPYAFPERGLRTDSSPWVVAAKSLRSEAGGAKNRSMCPHWTAT